MNLLLNGKLINSMESYLSVNGEGFNYGYGLFETIKLVDSKIFFIEEHFERLKKGCYELNMQLDYDLETLKDFATKLVLSNGILSGSVKMLYVKNNSKYDLIITTKENTYTPDKYEKGFEICFASNRKNQYAKLTYIKSNNYLENLLEKDAAVKNGYNEAIFLNTEDKISEGTYTNIFFVKDNVIHTPSVSCGILPGIMREKIIDLINTFPFQLMIGAFSREALLHADEIFLTNSLMEILPVARVENKTLSLANNKITRALRERFYNYYY